MSDSIADLIEDGCSTDSSDCMIMGVQKINQAAVDFVYGGLSEEQVIRQWEITGEELDDGVKKLGIVGGRENLVMTEDDFHNAGRTFTALGGVSRKSERSYTHHSIVKNGRKNHSLLIDYTADKFRNEMRAFKKFMSDIILEYASDVPDIKIVNVGVKQGRMTQYLTHEFGHVVGVVFDKKLFNELVDKYPDCKFSYSSESDVSKIPEVLDADVVMFTRTFYKLDVIKVLNELGKLQKKPLIIINEPNIHTHWEDPVMDRDSPLFDSKIYANTMLRLAEVEKQIRESVFTVLTHESRRDLGSDVFVLRKYTLKVSNGMNVVKKFVLNAIKKYINDDPSNLVMIDVGTGIGRYAFFLESYFKKVIGVDSNNKRIEAAKAVAKSLKSDCQFYTCAAESMYGCCKKYKPSVILFANAFHHMPFDEVAEQLALLKRDRKILIIIKQALSDESGSEESKALEQSLRYLSDARDISVIDQIIDKDTNTIVLLCV